MTDKDQVEAVGDCLLVRAPAKINLSLLIAGERQDGFHEIETIMAKVNLYDQILIEKGKTAGIELLCNGQEWSPEGQENLVYKAAKTLLESCNRLDDIKITLTKNIPAGAGLGSASSDAAATLIGLNRYMDLHLPNHQLAKLAAQLGSDVAFFLDGPLALCTGKGEKIKKLDKNFNFLALLILPDVNVSTTRVYANYKHNPNIYKRLNERINDHLGKNRIDLVTKLCTNMLEISCFDLYEELADLKVKIESFVSGPLCLSGSGSSMFYIIDKGDIIKAMKFKDKIKEKTGCKTVIVSNNRW